jgi:hypothetical protein
MNCFMRSYHSLSVSCGHEVVVMLPAGRVLMVGPSACAMVVNFEMFVPLVCG